MTPEARLRERIRTPVLVLTALAWLALALGLADLGANPADAGGGGQLNSSGAHGPHSAHLHQAVSGAFDPFGQAPAPGGQGNGMLALIWAWSLMLLAMTGPLLIPALRHVTARSLPNRRWRSSTLVVAGYAVAWSVGLLVLTAGASAARALPSGAGSGLAGLAVGVLGAAAWQLSPAKQSCLNHCHMQPPLAAFDRAADLDAARFGAMHGLWCFGSCWGLMLIPVLVSAHHLLVMALASVWMWLEHLESPARPTWHWRLPRRSGRIVAATVRSRFTARVRPGLS